VVDRDEALELLGEAARLEDGVAAHRCEGPRGWLVRAVIGSRMLQQRASAEQGGEAKIRRKNRYLRCDCPENRTAAA
jgi:hypothetical protein